MPLTPIGLPTLSDTVPLVYIAWQDYPKNRHVTIQPAGAGTGNLQIIFLSYIANWGTPNDMGNLGKIT